LKSRYDVVGIGNAIVDVISRESEEFIDRLGLVKEAMTLIDADRAVELYAAMSPAVETSGGSAANTIAGLASFGADVAYVGKVRDDQLGAVFAHDIRAVGVDYQVAAAADGPPTARCLIVVTPDAARTMNTFLGISSLLGPDDIDEGQVAAGEILYCEGYIWDMDVSKQAIRKAVEAARAAGRRVSFTLSDTFCVQRHHDEWLDLVDGPIDILFANEHELEALYECDLAAAVDRVQGRVDIACVTLGAAGSIIVTPDERIEVAPVPVDVVDTTGAGDLYASGFLFGHSRGLDLETCGALASAAAAEAISHVGARPLVGLADLAASIVDQS
jgi:sugar/nucleoside kinase (ribokinase family)